MRPMRDVWVRVYLDLTCKPTQHNLEPPHAQIGAGTTGQRIVEPGKGLVGQAAAAGTGTAEDGGRDTVFMTENPSKEKGYLAEVDMPSPAGDVSEAAEDW